MYNMVQSTGFLSACMGASVLCAVDLQASGPLQPTLVSTAAAHGQQPTQIAPPRVRKQQQKKPRLENSEGAVVAVVPWFISAIY
jgi:hypothetical protein